MQELPDPYDLTRFIVAQDPLWHRVIAELQAGAKQSHWMWFVFPQITGLGSSPMAQRYAVSGLEEARAYLAHTILGTRLIDTSRAVLTHRGRRAAAILGEIDAIKLRSSMTLFEAASTSETVFATVLEDFFGGNRDPHTHALLANRHG